MRLTRIFSANVFSSDCLWCFCFFDVYKHLNLSLSPLTLSESLISVRFDSLRLIDYLASVRVNFACLPACKLCFMSFLFLYALSIVLMHFFLLDYVSYSLFSSKMSEMSILMRSEEVYEPMRLFLL